MFKKRYEIQVIYKSDGPSRRWRTFYRANARRTLSSARKELEYWSYHEWDFVSDQPTFRIYDRKAGRAVG